VNVHDSGAGPRNISDIFTQSRLSPLARSVSFRDELVSDLLNVKEASQKAPTELVAPAEERGAVVNPRREAFENPNGDVAVMEGQCLAEIAARGVDTSCISSKLAA
jgi:hypothetical protein